jgi:hypothetical protein
MDMQRLETLPPPPGVIASLQAGFDIVSSRIALIALPLLLDVFLWLGPRVSVGNSFSAGLSSWIDLLKRGGASSSEIAMYTTNAPVLLDAAHKLNWLGWVRTFPIGVPAMMLDLPKELPVMTPLGAQAMIEAPSFLWMMASILLLTLIGWMAGGWYFRLVAGASMGEVSSERRISLGRAFVQTFLLSIIWRVVSLLTLAPVMIVISLFAAVSPLLAQVVSFVILFFAFWLVAPVMFMPHGIFMHKQNAIVSILSSLRMARFTLPTSNMFMMGGFVLWLGLDYLWKMPANDSWLMLVGITGHAFILTTLLSASFVYYRDMNEWLQNVHQQYQQMSHRSPEKKV